MICRVALFPILVLLTIACFNPTVSGQGAPKPATLAELAEVIDWQKLPSPPKVSQIDKQVTYRSFNTSLTPPQAIELYSKALTSQDWVVDESKTWNKNIGEDKYFMKNGFRFHVSAERRGEAGQTHVQMKILGNVDAAKLPCPENIERPDPSNWSHQNYTTKLSIDSMIAFLREKMGQLGWREYVPPYETPQEPKTRQIEFVQNTSMMRCYLSEGKGKTYVRYSVDVRSMVEPSQVTSWLSKQPLPKPPKLDEYVKVINMRHVPLMPHAQSPGGYGRIVQTSAYVDFELAEHDASKVAEFYRPVFTKLGWSILHENSSKSRCELLVEKNGYRICVNVGFRTITKDKDKNVAKAGSAQAKPDPGLPELLISLNLISNVDLRRLPFPQGV